jgi:hypothetical protein
MSRSPLDSKNHLDSYHPHKLSITNSLLDEILVKYVGNVFCFRVYIVDGYVIRNNVDIDFTTGGNSGRFPYVPNDEIWLEYHHNINDWSAILLHETVECYLMIKHHFEYSTAHDIANIHEWSLRQKMNDGEAGIKNAHEMCAMVDHIIDPILTNVESMVIGFPVSEHQSLKDRLSQEKSIFTTRISDEYDKYEVGQQLITPWGDEVAVMSIMKLDDLKSHPFYGELTDAQKSELRGHKFDLIELNHKHFGIHK